MLCNIIKEVQWSSEKNVVSVIFIFGMIFVPGLALSILPLFFLQSIRGNAT